MQELARKNFTVERVELSDDELQDHFADNPYKLEIISDKIEDGGGSTIYKQDDWYDLCLGPHVPNTSRLMHVKLTSVSSAYWRGDQDREQLVRIYGIVEPSKEALRATLTRLEEAKKRDHRKLGKDLQLFHIDEEVGQGLILVDTKGGHHPSRTAGLHFLPSPPPGLFTGVHASCWQVGFVPDIWAFPLLPRFSIPSACRTGTDEKTGR